MTTLPNGEKVYTIKIGRSLNLKKREAGYRQWAKSLRTNWGTGPFCVVKVDDYICGEKLLKDHFKKYNVEREFGFKARQAMSPEMVERAETFGMVGRCCAASAKRRSGKSSFF